MTPCLFVSDLHGRFDRYETLLRVIEEEKPAAVFLGGDLLPMGALPLPGGRGDFLLDWLGPRLEALRERLGAAYPRVLAIFGNDDPRAEASSLAELERRGLGRHAHGRCLDVAGVSVYGYACVPPTPFMLKDWERYDVSRYVDPGCVSPEEGFRSVPADPDDAKWSTIAKDLARLAGGEELERAIFLFHTPPYDTPLDRAALDGRTVDGVPLDPHVGSIAVRRFLEDRGPLISLHGHVHEAARLTGRWLDQLDGTVMLSAAHDGPELALVRFDPESPDSAVRELLPAVVG